MKPEKKPTNAQLQRRLERAVLHIDRDKETQEVYVADSGLRMTITEDYALVGTLFHRHVFDKVTSAGISRPYLYTKRAVEILLMFGVQDKEGGYLFDATVNALKESGKETERTLLQYFEWWVFNMQAPLYGIGESDADVFLVYEQYVHNIARNNVLLEEHKEDVTNRAFFESVFNKMREVAENASEYVVLHKMTDEEIVEREARALQEQEEEDALKRSMEDGEQH